MNAPSPLLSLGAPLSSHSRVNDKAGPGQLYLRMRVPGIAPQASEKTAPAAYQSLLISMEAVQEVLSLPVQRLSPMPGMPAPVLGLMNRGNRIFWLVDLALMLGLAPLESNLQQHNVLILRVGTFALGLAVSELQPMIWLADEQLQSDVSLLNPQLRPFVSHVVKRDETSFWLLREQSILQSPLLSPLGLKSA